MKGDIFYLSLRKDRIEIRTFLHTYINSTENEYWKYGVLNFKSHFFSFVLVGYTTIGKNRWDKDGLVACQNYKTQNWQKKKKKFLVKEVTFCDFFFLQLKFRWCITREEFIIELKSKCKNTILEEQKKKKHNQVELSSFEKKVIRTPGMQRLRIKLQVKLDVIRIILFIRGGGWNLRLLGWDRWGASGAAPWVSGGSRRWKATSGGRRWGLRRTRGGGRMGGRK